jgi:hypothetical protein
MRFLLLVAVVIILCSISCVRAVESSKSWLGSFFSPVPIPDLPDKQLSFNVEWKLRPIIALPALKVTKSTRENAILDVGALTSTGAGISLQRLEYDLNTEKWDCTFSISPVTILFSGSLAPDRTIDLSWVTTVGFFNNIIMFGFGYDFGSAQARSRLFGVLSVGMNFNN